MDFDMLYLLYQFLLQEKESFGLPDSLWNILRYYSLSKLLAQEAIRQDAELIVKDMAASVIEQVPNAKKYGGKAALWSRVDFEDGRCIGGSTFWIPVDESIHAGQKKSSRSKKEKQKIASIVHIGLRLRCVSF
jgi:hypothetical protein